MSKDAKTYAEDTGLLFMETSAKTAINVNELFLAIGETDALGLYSSQNSRWTGDNLASQSIKSFLK